jgi:hypothetical protein
LRSMLSMLRARVIRNAHDGNLALLAKRPTMSDKTRVPLENPSRANNTLPRSDKRLSAAVLRDIGSLGLAQVLALRSQERSPPMTKAQQN